MSHAPTSIPTTEALGITRDQASDWQRLAAEPEDGVGKVAEYNHKKRRGGLGPTAPASQNVGIVLHHGAAIEGG
jgi:hypothetical protein